MAMRGCRQINLESNMHKTRTIYRALISGLILLAMGSVSTAREISILPLGDSITEGGVNYQVR